MRFSVAAIFIGTAAAAIVGGSQSQSHSGGDSRPTGSHSGDTRPTGSHSAPPQITSTIWTTRESTIYACPSTVTDCPVESKTPVAVVTDTVVLDTTICPLSESHRPTAKPIATSSCMGHSETCTVTVTKKGPPPMSMPHNATSANAHATGTGTPIQSAKAYYSNAASSLAGGAMAVGAAALAVLAL